MDEDPNKHAEAQSTCMLWKKNTEIIKKKKYLQRTNKAVIAAKLTHWDNHRGFDSADGGLCS